MPIPERVRWPADEHDERDDGTLHATTAERVALLLVRLVALPFLILALILWAVALLVIVLVRRIFELLRRLVHRKSSLPPPVILLASSSGDSHRGRRHDEG